MMNKNNIIIECALLGFEIISVKDVIAYKHDGDTNMKCFRVLHKGGNRRRVRKILNRACGRVYFCMHSIDFTYITNDERNG